MIILTLVLALLWGALLESASCADEYLERWTPGGDTNAFDLPYRHRHADYEREGDDRRDKLLRNENLVA